MFTFSRKIITLWPDVGSLFENKKTLVFACVFAVFVEKITTIFQPIYLGRIVDHLSITTNNFNFTSLYFLLGMFCVFGLASSAFSVLKNYFLMILKEKIRKEISEVLLKRIQTFSHDFFYRKNVSYITEVLNLGLEAIHNIIMVFLSEVVPYFFELILVFIVITIKIDIFISVPLVITFGLYILVSLIYTPKEVKTLENIKDSRMKLSSLMYENITNFDAIKIIHAEKSKFEIYSEALKLSYSFIKDYGSLFLTKALIQNVILYLGLFCVLFISSIELINSNMSPGNFVMMNAFFLQITFPLVGVLRSYDTFRKSIVNCRPLFELLAKKPELCVLEPKVNFQNCSKIDLAFSDVSFSYGSEKTLSNITFSIPMARKISLVGPTGGGKSTIGKLMMRFYDPDSGSITINNVDIRQIPFSNLRNLIGYVPQEIILLQDTIANNIIMGRENISIEDLSTLVEKNSLLKFVADLEDGFQTVVGDKGLTLSGGQKQRIGLARILVGNPKLLILDEHSSAFDINTELEIHKIIKDLGCSVLMIAHRLSNVIDSDEILVIQNGRIEKNDQHSNLIRESGWYQKAWHQYSKNAKFMPELELTYQH